MNACPSPSVTTQACSSLTSITVSIRGVPRGMEESVLRGQKGDDIKCVTAAYLKFNIQQQTEEYSHVARLQQRLWDFITAGPAGHLGNTVDIVNVGFVVLVSPATQQRRLGAALTTQRQHTQ